MFADRDLTDDLAFALALADLVDAFTLPRFEAADFRLGWKDDRSEVTEVDRSAEQLLAEQVLSHRPADGFFGEEFGVRGNAESSWRWIVDPIDGTSGFVRGMPIWATLIALTHQDDDSTPTVGVAVVSAPALGRRWWATAGGGTFADGRRCDVSDVASVTDAQVNITLNDGWHELGASEALVALMVAARRSRGVGDFWQHCLVAEGALDVAVDAIGVAPYDLAAVRLIVEEAGGRFTDRFGNRTHLSDSAISTNGVLHDEVLDRIGR